jgi:glycosyltransferase involved in cell wall biosynthesis
LKLLFLSNLFPDSAEPWRGLDNATLLHHLAQRWQIRVLAVRPVLPWRSRTWHQRAQDSVFQPCYIPVPYLPKIGSRWNHQLMARALRKPFRELRSRFAFDVVLGSWLFPDCCALAELAAAAAVPFVAIAQGSDAHQYLGIPVRRRIMLEKLPRASAIVTRSGELARQLATAGFSADQLHPIYNGIDFAQFTPAGQTEARRELKLPEQGRLILFVGNFYPIKNPLLLVEAHARLCAETMLGDCHLVMIGGGPLENEARNLADQLGLGDRVIFAGRKDAASVARHMQAADVLAVPSRNEGVPNVILEAFACSLPVVAAHVGGIPEVLTSDFLGRLVEPGNRDALTAGLRTVLASPPDRARIHDHARQFSWERTTAAYDEILRRTVR